MNQKYFSRLSFIGLKLALLVICFLIISGSQAQKTITAFPLKTSPVIDGVFDSKCWAGADSATNFTQLEPLKGAPSTEKTIVFVGYDSLNVYVFFRCYQQSPVSGKRNTRDEISKNDDAIAVTLDTYNDGRSSFGFLLNPLGTQTDFRIDDDGKILDSNWDAEWKSAVQTTGWGWCAELAIPFRSIKFNRKNSEWGVNFARVILGNSETTYWSGQLSEDFRISQGGKLSGINTPENDQKLVVFPYTTLQYDSKNADFKAGGDLKWQINSNISVNATYNPDFATVEADQQQVNLTRYEINYPEKRLFFQEGNSMFNTRIKTFYSRRVKDIDLGIKFNGKVGPYQINLISAHSLEQPGSSEPSSLFTAARVKRDFLKSSFAGITLVDKLWDGQSTHLFSADYSLNLGETWKLTGQFVGSASTLKIVNPVSSTRNQFFQHSAWFMRFARENNVYHYHIRYSDAGENFGSIVNQTGYVTDDNRRELDGEVTYKWWLKNNTFKYIFAATNNNIFWSHRGILRSWNQYDFLKLMFKNKFNLEYEYNDEFKLYEKEYFNQLHSIITGYNTDEWSSVEAMLSAGKNYDRQLRMISLDASVKATNKLSLEYSGKYVHFDPDPTNASTYLNVLTVNYYYTNNLWMKVFAQNSTANNKFYLYGLLGWRFKPPFGALYLIYSHDEYSLHATIEKKSFNNVFLKFTYPIYIKG
ncbi:MAG: DUF5916 domain-containing protein [Bacteroidota bacterium]|nr:DUF5916 domain-containing protein [Bacteroidota bacterium]